MAKEKRSVSDLDEELAALEAELAALEGRAPPPRKPAPKPAVAPPPAPKEAPDGAPEPAKKPRFGFGRGKKDEPTADPDALPAQTPEAATTVPAPAKKKLGLPSFGRKKDEPSAPEPAPFEPRAPTPPPRESAPAPRPSPVAAPAPNVPVTDPSVWRQEADGAWVRTVPGRPRATLRRILDEEDRVVREEPIRESDLSDDGPAEPEPPRERAKPNLGRLFRRKG